MISLAGLPTLLVGFGGYEEPCEVVRGDSWPPNDENAFSPGIAGLSVELSIGSPAPNFA